MVSIASTEQSPVAQHSPSGWLQDATSSAEYTTSPSHDSRVYVSSPMYSSVPAPTPPYVWTGEPHSQSPPVQAAQFLSSPTYHDRSCSKVPSADGSSSQQADRHRSLEQRRASVVPQGPRDVPGPAWGEIARLIGTRTSTQVRTHAQKFFTKLARLNQTMPYFEVQIQKERARLVAQGASVTPTAQSASLPATLSPRKRLASTSNSPRQSLKRYKEEVASPTYAAAVQARYPQETYDAKPRVYTGGYSSAASPSTASLQLTQLQMADVGRQTSPTAALDAESLPSMNKLLHRSSNTAASTS
ncbi:Homeodomain-like [Phytophthora cactorum]|nr:Homeodomain-like [Phytophthora cactorum]